jgi:hypothetical protein
MRRGEMDMFCGEAKYRHISVFGAEWRRSEVLSLLAAPPAAIRVIAVQ